MKHGVLTAMAWTAILLGTAHPISAAAPQAGAGATAPDGTPLESVEKLQAEIVKAEGDLQASQAELAPLEKARQDRNAELEKARAAMQGGYYNFAGPNPAADNYNRVNARVKDAARAAEWPYASATLKVATAQERLTDLKRRLLFTQAVRDAQSGRGRANAQASEAAYTAADDAEVKALDALANAILHVDRLLGVKQTQMSAMPSRSPYSRGPAASSNREADDLAAVTAKKKAFDQYYDATQAKLKERQKELAEIRNEQMSPQQKQNQAQMQQMLMNGILKGMANLPDNSAQIRDQLTNFNRYCEDNAGHRVQMPGALLGSACTINAADGLAYRGVVRP
jgi:hypothetical protein